MTRQQIIKAVEFRKKSLQAESLKRRLKSVI